mmetsp:Transcript_18690/g.40540  ORF Transcript_18690/g.40540 Transcript_18690/m.40540 type:complete len:185 (+) Transcript_18690:260-814(+)
MPLRPFRYGGDDRVGIGISPQVLFIRLFGDLRAIFPCANVTFGMGNDVFECLLDSKHYFETQGLTWSPSVEAVLNILSKNSVVFGRHAEGEVLTREFSLGESEKESLPLQPAPGTLGRTRSSEGVGVVIRRVSSSGSSEVSESVARTSSSAVRDAISRGEDISVHVPPAIAEYVAGKGLYKGAK